MKAYFSHSELIKADNPMNTVAKKVYEEAAKQTESILMSQLNELISRGLLVVEETQPMLIQSYQTAESPGVEVRIEKGVRLVLKDQEYVKSLEQQIIDLNCQICEVLKELDEYKETFEKIVAMKQNKE